MSKGSRKFVGFLWALIIAIVSFFVIFIFFPDVSTKFFGVSVNKENARKAIDSAASEIKDAAGIAETVGDKAKDLIDSIGDEFK